MCHSVLAPGLFYAMCSVNVFVIDYILLNCRLILMCLKLITFCSVHCKLTTLVSVNFLSACGACACCGGGEACRVACSGRLNMFLTVV